MDTVKATLDCARADIEAEDERMKVLDGKLNTLATFSALSVSIIASLGANVLVSGGLDRGFSIVLGALLAGAALMLLLTTLTAFRGLRPKEYQGITLETAEVRVTPKRLSDAPQHALAVLAATYYELLPSARSANNVKLEKVSDAFRYAKLGLIGLVLAIVITAVGSADRKGSTDARDTEARCDILRGGSPGSTKGGGRFGSPDRRGCDRIHREGSD